MSKEYIPNSISHLHPRPRIIPREEHNISRRMISEGALNVLYKLKNGGYQAYLVGGSVRDLLLGREPKDFDVVTDARPEQIRELFQRSRLIGRRFRLAHVRHGREIIEVSTFRAPHHIAAGEGHSVDGRIIRDNVYGTMDEDVWRRDLTVNALFYNIADFSVVDYVGGMADIQSAHIRLIGEPVHRFTEDPVRLLRAVRFAAKLGFRIDAETEKVMPELAHLLKDIPAARLFEESLKLFLSGAAVQSFELLRRYALFAVLFPQTEAALAVEEDGFPQTLLIHALENTDSRLAADKPVTPGFLIAALLWDAMHRLADNYVRSGMREVDALSLAGDVVISKQTSSTSMPRRFTQMAREIWQLQPRLKRHKGKQPQRLLQHPRFRAAYDFLLLRVQAGEPLQELADWWTDVQKSMPERHARPSAAGKRRHYYQRRRRPTA